MPLPPKELPQDLRDFLLAQLKQQLGQDKYEEMIGALGEDRLLDLYLSQPENQTGSGGHAPSSAKTYAPTNSYSTNMVVTLLGWLFLAWAYSSYLAGIAAPGAFESSFPPFGQILVGLNYIVFCGLMIVFAGNDKELDWSKALIALLCLAGLIAAITLLIIGIVRMVS